MKRAKIVYLGIVVIFIIGLVIGVGAYRSAPAFAEENKNTEKANPVDDFLSRVASILGVEESDLTDAMEQAKTEMVAEKLADVKAELDAKVVSGDITQEQANERLEGLSKRIEMMGKKAEMFRQKGGSPFGGFKKHGGKHGKPGRKYWGNHGGKPKGLNLEDIKIHIQEAVERGEITQEQADERLKGLKKPAQRPLLPPNAIEIEKRLKLSVDSGTITEEEAMEMYKNLTQRMGEMKPPGEADIKERIQAAVDSGQITQEQAEERYKAWTEGLKTRGVK